MNFTITYLFKGDMCVEHVTASSVQDALFRAQSKNPNIKIVYSIRYEAV